MHAFPSRLRYTGASAFSGATLQHMQTMALDGVAGGLPAVYGVCGMGVGQLLDAAGSPVNTLAVGALDGHLLLFELPTTGGIGPLLYQTRVEGSVGNYNSILFADMDQFPGNELVAAGSLGLRRWVR